MLEKYVIRWDADCTYYVGARKSGWLDLHDWGKLAEARRFASYGDAWDFIARFPLWKSEVSIHEVKK